MEAPIAPSSSSSLSGSVGMLLDGDELLMLEESFRIIGDDDEDDEGMDFDELEPLPLDEGEPLLLEMIAGRASSSMWHHSAPCDLVGSSSSSSSLVDNPAATAAEMMTSGGSSPPEDLLAAAVQRQWAPRDGGGYDRGHSRRRASLVEPASFPQRPNKLKKSKSFSVSPASPVVAVVAARQPLNHPGRSLQACPENASMNDHRQPGQHGGQPQQPHLQQYQPPSEEELIRRLTASMRRSTETRSCLFGARSRLFATTGPVPAASMSNKRHRTSAPPALLGDQIKAFREEQIQEPEKGTEQQQIQESPKQQQVQQTQQWQLAQTAQPQPPRSPNPEAAPSSSTCTAPSLPPVAPVQSILRLSGFLSGDLKTLTSGLEWSRDMIRRHGSLICQSQNMTT